MTKSNINDINEPAEPDEDADTNIYNGGSGDDGDKNPEYIIYVAICHFRCLLQLALPHIQVTNLLESVHMETL